MRSTGKVSCVGRNTKASQKGTVSVAALFSNSNHGNSNHSFMELV